MISHKTTDNGFQYLEIDNALATARVALQGGHLFHYQQHGKNPLLWLSGASHFSAGKAIRGGIPLCWPWFGKHPQNPALPQHGFARTSCFELVDSTEVAGGSSELFLQLLSSKETLALWPHRFQLRLHITIGKRLHVALTSKNCDDQPFTISSALHSYFNVSNINKVRVRGLAQEDYLDTLTGEMQRQEGDVNIWAEVDRVYQTTGQTILLRDGNRTIEMRSEGSGSVVVWNPWLEKTLQMADMDRDGYQTMLCLETANAMADARELVPGAEHTLAVVLAEGT